MSNVKINLNPTKNKTKGKKEQTKAKQNKKK
jgi:hypothetical protein